MKKHARYSKRQHSEFPRVRYRCSPPAPQRSTQLLPTNTFTRWRHMSHHQPLTSMRLLTFDPQSASLPSISSLTSHHLRTLLRQRQMSTHGTSNALLFDRCQQGDLYRRLLNMISSPQPARYGPQTTAAGRLALTDPVIVKFARYSVCPNCLNMNDVPLRITAWPQLA